MTTQAKTTLAEALLGVQRDAPDLHFDATNPHFKNKFLSLHGLTSALRPILAKHKLVVLQFPTTLDGQPALRTKLLHAESGEAEEDTMLLAATQMSPQQQGSAISYARRYSLMAILGLVADEDDDANAATKPAGEPRAAATTEPATAPAPAALSDGGDPSAVVLTFGKHSGKQVADVPVAYLKWWSEQEEPKTAELRRVRAAVNIFLKQAA